MLAFGSDYASEVHNPNTRNLRNKNFAAQHLFRASQNEGHTLLERNQKPSHLRMGYCQATGRTLRQEIRNDTTAAADHISIPNDAEARSVKSGICVCRHEQLVGAELRSTIQVNWIRRLVGA